MTATLAWWHQKYQEIVQYIENDQSQQESAKDENILANTEHGVWIEEQSSNYRAKRGVMRFEELRDKWLEFEIKYRSNILGDCFDKNYKKYVEFLQKHKRIPADITDNEDEKRLAQWVRNYRNFYNKNTQLMAYPPARTAWELLEYEISYVRESLNEQAWNLLYAEVYRYISFYLKLPKIILEDSMENNLYKWLEEQKEKFDKNSEDLPQKQYDCLQRLYQNFPTLFTQEHERWFIKYSETFAFIMAKNRAPLLENGDEYDLAVWYNSQVRFYESAKFRETLATRSQEILWKRLTDKLLALGSDEFKWQCKRIILEKFINDHKRKPSDLAYDREEKELGMWLKDELSISAKYAPDIKRYNLLKDLVNNGCTATTAWEHRWIETYRELKKFFQKKKSPPLRDSKDSKEKALANWYHRQKTNYIHRKSHLVVEKNRKMWKQLMEAMEKN